MGRFIGGRIGNFIQRRTSNWAEDGIHTLSDQLYQKSLNGWKEGVSASGGDSVVIAASGYKYHVFKNPGTFILTSSDPQVVDVLIVGGGGAGGNNQGGGGGGAGGVKFLNQHPISPGPYSITVGEGGQANTTTTNTPGAYPTYGGKASTAFGWTCGGGGAGSQYHSNFDPAQTAPNPGAPNYVRGCGGGSTGRNGAPGGDGLTTGGSCVAGGSPSDIDAGGGGGGAGGAGQPSPENYHAGDGGTGLAVPQFPATDLSPAFDSTWAAAVTAIGYYGGGGGGGTELNNVNDGFGSGGVGGGGKGRHAGVAWPSAERDGTDYTGGGGGGYGFTPDIWSTGGKGVVIIRY